MWTRCRCSSRQIKMFHENAVLLQGNKILLKEMCIWLPVVKDWTTLSGRGAERSATSVGNADFTKEIVSNVKYWIPNVVGTKYMRRVIDWIAYNRPFWIDNATYLPKMRLLSIQEVRIPPSYATTCILRWKLSTVFVESMTRQFKTLRRGAHAMQQINMILYWFDCIFLSMFLAMWFAVSKV